jgi:hypothetical protein
MPRETTTTTTTAAGDDEDNDGSSSSVENFLTEGNFQRVHALERLILETPDFARFCVGSDLYSSGSASDLVPAGTPLPDDAWRGCTSPSSLLSYFYPSVDEDTGELT